MSRITERESVRAKWALGAMRANGDVVVTIDYDAGVATLKAPDDMGRGRQVMIPTRELEALFGV